MDSQGSNRTPVIISDLGTCPSRVHFAHPSLLLPSYANRFDGQTCGLVMSNTPLLYKEQTQPLRTNPYPTHCMSIYIVLFRSTILMSNIFVTDLTLYIETYLQSPIRQLLTRKLYSLISFYTSISLLPN